MKNLFKTIIAVVAVGTLALSSCNKYEEGANFSIRSKKGRLSGDWHVTKVEYNGSDVTSSFLPSGASYHMDIAKDGTWKSTYTFSSVSSNEAGTWELVEKKEKLKVVTTGSSDTDGDTSEIVMLKNKMLKLRSGSTGDITVMTMEQD